MRTVAISSLAMALLVGCTYNAPPEASLVFPEGGTYRVGDDLLLEFSEPVDTSTLAVRIWPSSRDVEGELLDNPLECGMYRAGFGTYLPPLRHGEEQYWIRHHRKLRKIATHIDDIKE